MHTAGREEDRRERADAIVREAISVAIEDGADRCLEGLPLLLKTGIEVRLGERLEHRDTCCECERIARERPCLIDVAERRQAVHDVGTTTEGPDGKPTADDLAEAGKVRTNTIELLRTTTGNMGLIPPAPGFLEELRRVTEEEGVLLIFDEVISGFRAARGGAQELYGIRPDLTCLGKIIGGGLPVGAFGGRADIMDRLAPLGDVYQAGTLSGNPLALAAGITMLQALAEPDFYTRLEEKGQAFEATIRPILDRYTDRLSYNRVGSLSTIFFTPGGVHSNADAKRSDTEAYARYFRGMIERGIYLPPSQFECIFLSMAHSREDFDRTATAMDEVLREVLG